MQLLINDLLSYSLHMQTVDHFELIDINEILCDVISDLEIDIKENKYKRFHIYHQLTG
jgi:hypothetical protein